MAEPVRRQCRFVMPCRFRGGAKETMRCRHEEWKEGYCIHHHPGRRLIHVRRRIGALNRDLADLEAIEIDLVQELAKIRSSEPVGI